MPALPLSTWSWRMERHCSGIRIDVGIINSEAADTGSFNIYCASAA